MEIEYNEDIIAGYDWLNILSIARRIDYTYTSYVIIFNDLRVIIWWAGTGDVITIAGD